MELKWKEIDAERLIRSTSSQIHLNESLPSPDGKGAIEIVSIKTKMTADEVFVNTDEITLKGRIKADVTAEGTDGGLFSYESFADYSHLIKVEGAAPGMTAEIRPMIQSLSAFPDKDGARIDADIDLDVMLVSDLPIKVTDGIIGVPDLEMKTKTASCSKRSVIQRTRLRMREEIAAEDAAEVISSEGLISVKDISVEQGSVTVNGVIAVSGVIRNKNEKLSQKTDLIPYHEKISIDGGHEDIICEAVIDSLYMRAVGEEFGIISVEAEALFTLYEISKKDYGIPVDAFSPSIGFDCLYEDFDMISCLGRNETAAVIKESLTIPNGTTASATPLIVSAEPVITESMISGDSIEITGVLITKAVFETTEGRIDSVQEDVPFTVYVDSVSGCELPAAEVSCVASITGYSERNLSVQYNISVGVWMYKTEKISVITGLAEKERKDRKSGLIVYFASEGEDFFDAAKKCGVPCAEITELNQDVVSPFEEGEKLLALV